MHRLVGVLAVVFGQNCSVLLDLSCLFWQHGSCQKQQQLLLFLAARTGRFWSVFTDQIGPNLLPFWQQMGGDLGCYGLEKGFGLPYFCYHMDYRWGD